MAPAYISYNQYIGVEPKRCRLLRRDARAGMSSGGAPERLISHNQEVTEMPDDTIIETNEQDYITEIQRLRDTTVSKEQYNKLLEDNKRLIQSLANGDKQDETDASGSVSIDDLRKQLAHPDDMSNLEYVAAALDLRDALIEAGLPDPFLPNGTHAHATAADREAAERVAAVMRECVDAADGNDGVFTAQLMARTYEPQIRR